MNHSTCFLTRQESFTFSCSSIVGASGGGLFAACVWNHVDLDLATMGTCHSKVAHTMVWVDASSAPSTGAYILIGVAPFQQKSHLQALARREVVAACGRKWKNFVWENVDRKPWWIKLGEYKDFGGFFVGGCFKYLLVSPLFWGKIPMLIMLTI